MINRTKLRCLLRQKIMDSNDQVQSKGKRDIVRRRHSENIPIYICNRTDDLPSNPPRRVQHNTPVFKTSFVWLSCWLKQGTSELELVFRSWNCGTHHADTIEPGMSKRRSGYQLSWRDYSQNETAAKLDSVISMLFLQIQRLSLHTGVECDVQKASTLQHYEPIRSRRRS